MNTIHTAKSASKVDSKFIESMTLPLWCAFERYNRTQGGQEG